jgi:hypothetical protein
MAVQEAGRVPERLLPELDLPSRCTISVQCKVHGMRRLQLEAVGMASAGQCRQGDARVGGWLVGPPLSLVSLTATPKLHHR